MRASRRHSSRTESEDPPDQPSTSSGSRTNSPKKARVSAEDETAKVELIARLLSQIRAIRDRREAQLWKQLRRENSDWSEEVLKERISERLSDINTHVQDLEMRTTGVLLEELIKVQVPKLAVVHMQPSVSLSTSFRSPEAASSSTSPKKTFEPIEIKTEETMSTASGPASVAHSTSSLSVNTAETTVEKAAKQEASVMARIAELRRTGMWTKSRLPLCVEPQRNKTHWDYLLEEVKWMANDFRQERIFKRNMAKKVATAIVKQKREQELGVERAEQKVIRDGKRICASIAKMVRDFWQNVDKVVDFKAQEIIESKKRKALDQHLAFIVGEADKLSNMVQEGLTQDKTSKTPSIASMDDLDNYDLDEEESSDDETTLDQEEKHLKNDDVTGEVNALAEEADQGMDDLFASLPPEYVAMLKKEAEAKAGTSGGSRKMSPARPPRPLSASLVDYGSSDSSDNEETEMKMEEGKKGQSSESGTKDVKKEETDGESSAKRRRLEEQENEGKEGRDGEEGDQKTDDQEGNGDGRGVLEKVDYCKLNSDNSDERQQELANIAEEALKLQPKGFTLETTQVKTAVPFLMRGTLREYQMVGLDWLVTLYEKNLNGILADEMGLGKTIQTIALLAHLACSESIWGPHLIVVPTSVILNWEMELKRWCPAFKILTYFGSVKDRQEKRKGWSKPNAFHVCITSYKTITTDIRAFKMKAWQYLILDEAQNIKNWKSQRWQALLNVRARRRLLLTGTPLQNSLMELWSLMHFLMPAIFASHDDFKDWFSNPLTGMMDGSVEYNAPLVQRLHKVLRPFILRRLKSEVEKQLPAKTESVIKCPLSKRQRYLYDDFMSKRTTRDNLKSGNMMSVLNIVMQLRKCCNHPNLFEPRPVVSPFSVPVIERKLPAMVFDLCGDNSRLDDKRDIPQCLDIRDRMCGWTSTVTSKRPTIEELEQCQESIAPPVVQGFKFQRPAANFKQPPCSLGGPVVGPSSAVSRTSSAGPLQSGFGQMVGEERNGIIKTEEDVRSVAENGEYGHGEAMAVDEVKQENDVQVNGGSGSCEESSSARLPAVEADTPEPSAARLPGSDSAATPVTTAAVPVRQVYGKKQGQRVTPLVHPYLRTSTVMSTMTPLSISTSDRGFNHDMAEGGARQPIANYNYQFSPPLKRKKVVDSPLISGQFQDCVPSEYQDRLRCIRRQRLERCQARFGQAPPPIFARELLSVLWHETRTTEEREDTDTWQRDGSNCEWDKIQSILMDHTERMMKRFVLYVDPVQVDSPRLFETSSGRPSFARLNEANCTEASRIFFNRTPSLTDRKLLSSRLQFPELRLIEYDCGKLQILANLLRELYMYKHRCLIFTQMSRMLDVLQAFLSFHGYQYFRLDGTTGVEQRQAMMERFNADPKIFCFILSTRSGGVGVNLTGADTVIFYDSDWNPTMDAQAQDRCHRIGQTRNVSIYRLISERTIEENILKKAMQKRRLGELAIDEAGFTPQFFKQNDNIRDLFEGEEVASEVAATVDAPKNQKDLETAMASLEDEQDVAAARQAAAEARADRAEFDESRAPTASQANGASEESKDDKYIELIEQLRPIERYAVNFLEAEYKPDFEDEVKETEAMIEQKKEDWVRAHEKAMKTADDDPLDDDFYGCGSLLDEVLAEGPDFFDQLMPSWTPPTPPLSDSDTELYHDDCLDLLYDPDFMGETQLPSTIHELNRPLLSAVSPVKRSHGHHNQHSSHGASSLLSTEQTVMQLLHSAAHQPFNQMTSSMMTSSQRSSAQPSPIAHLEPYNFCPATDFADIKTEEKTAPGSSAPSRKEKRRAEHRGATRDLLRAVTPPRAWKEEADYEGPEWSIIEDYALLQAVQNEDAMKHTLDRHHSALPYNWEYVSGYVNRITGFYRSPRQCSIRYQLAVRPREAGELLTIDPLTKKPRKVHLTQSELIHLRHSRTTTETQYEDSMSSILEARVLARTKMIKRLTQGTRKPYRRNMENVVVDSLNGRLPPNHETRLNELGVCHASSSNLPLAEDIVRIHEEKHHTQQRKNATDKLSDLRGCSPAFRSAIVTTRPPAVSAQPGVVMSKTPHMLEVPQIQAICPPAPAPPPAPAAVVVAQPQQSQDHPMTSLASAPATTRRVQSVGGGMQHMVSQSQHNYVVVGGHDQQAVRVQRQEAGGQTVQPVFRSLAAQGQNKRPHTPMSQGMQRAPVGYVTSGGGQSGGNFISTGQTAGGTYVTTSQQGGAGGAQRQGRVVSRTPGGRMYMTPSGTLTDRSYTVPPQMRMVAASQQGGPQRMPQKRAIGAKQPGMMTTMVMQGTRPSQTIQQIRAVPRGSQLPAGSRIMNVVMTPSPRTSSGQIIQGHGGSSMTRQLLTARGMGVVSSRGASPQTVAQVVIAPPASMQHQMSQQQQQQQQQQPVQTSQQSMMTSSADHAPSTAQQQQISPSVAQTSSASVVTSSSGPPPSSTHQ